MVVVLGALVLYNLAYSIAMTVFALSLGPFESTESYLLFVAEPYLCASSSILLVVLYLQARTRLPEWAAIAGVAAMVPVIYFGLTDVVDSDSFRRFMGLACAGAIVLVLAKRLWSFALATRWVVAGEIVVLLVLLTTGTPADVCVNEFGLMSGRPNTTRVIDHTSNPSKDNYPLFECRYNSLGYRDDEPDFESTERTRILVVGDSFVWGDGIPSNKETLGAQMREQLERQAPGKYALLAAGFAGLGLYGYLETVRRVGARYKPQIVVVGYLGASDHQVIDPQLLIDRLPDMALMRTIFLNLRVTRHAYSISSHGHKVVRHSGGTDYYRSLLEELAGLAREKGMHVIVLAYEETPLWLPASFDTLSLPKELQYQNKSSPLWYAKDRHPKPPLNRLIGEIVAKRVLDARMKLTP